MDTKADRPRTIKGLSVGGTAMTTDYVNGTHGPLIDEDELQEIDSPTLTSEERALLRERTYARTAINHLLDGKGESAFIIPRMLGQFASLYEEMLSAYEADGIDGARRVFQQQAAEFQEVADLCAVDVAQKKYIWTVKDLYETNFPDLRFIVPGIIPVGLIALGARPKIGKSWLALQLAVAVGIGGQFFDHEIEMGKVLYLAYEDSPRRIRNRLEKQGAPPWANITFGFSWRSLTGDGITDLVAAIERDQYTLIVIDTLARSLVNVDPNKQAEMNLYLGMLQRVALDRDLTILLVDHHRKQQGTEGDVVDDLIGATSKSGVIDALLGIYRKRGERSAQLKISGRDIEECELAVRFDRDTGTWECLGDTETVKLSTLDEEILSAVQLLGAPSLREVTDYTKLERTKAYRRLQELVYDGKLQLIDGNPTRYIIANQNTEDEVNDGEV